MPEQSEETPAIETQAQTQETNSVETPQQTTETAVETQPEQSTEQEVFKGEKTISFSEFAQKRQGVDKEEVKAKVKTEVEKEVLSEPETKVEPVAEVKSVQPVQQPSLKQTAQQKKRAELKELGIPETDYGIYEQMSSQAFEKVKAGITQVKQLAQKVSELEKTATRTAPPDSYTHPQGYLLDSGYARNAAALQKSTLIKNHLADQLDNISQGKPWRALQVGKDGEVYEVEEDLQPTEQAASKLRQQLRAVEVQDLKLEQEVTNIRQTYAQRHQQDIAYIKDIENKFFPDYDKEDHPTRAIQNQTIEGLPEAWRSHPLAKTLAKTVANNSIFNNQLTIAQKEIATLKAQLAQVQGNTQQPTKDKNLNGSGQSAQQANTPSISYEQFNRRRAGY
jgi:outer membrane biosynthesis protein TonB